MCTALSGGRSDGKGASFALGMVAALLTVARLAAILMVASFFLLKTEAAELAAAHNIDEQRSVQGKRHDEFDRVTFTYEWRCVMYICKT